MHGFRWCIMIVVFGERLEVEWWIQIALGSLSIVGDYGNCSGMFGLAEQ